jgi:hypothetical protein
MIVSFSVSNFRSFSEEETISLVASNRLSGMHDDHAVPIPDSKEKVLRTAVLYGANGAGKSNLFKALRYLKSVALIARPKNSGMGREPFRFGGQPDAPSSFDLQFIAMSGSPTSGSFRSSAIDRNCFTSAAQTKTGR